MSLLSSDLVVRNTFKVRVFELLSRILFKLKFHKLSFRFTPTIHLQNNQKFKIPFDQLGNNRLGLLSTSESYMQELKAAFPSFSIQDNDCVVDVGAHIGTFSVPLYLKYPGIDIYAYEANKDNYDLLKENVDLNNITKKFMIFNQAVYSNEGTIQFAKGMSSTTGSIFETQVYKIKNNKKRFFAKNEIVNNVLSEIKSTTLKNIINNNKIQKIKLLKLDCEGSEYAIMNSLSSEIAKNKIDYIILEYHPIKNENLKTLKSRIKLLGFDYIDKPFSNGCGMMYCRNILME